MVNNWYAVEEYAHQHQSELEAEAARKPSARAARAAGARTEHRSIFAGATAWFRVVRHAAVGAGHRRPTHPLRLPHVHLPHRHVPAAR